MSALAEDYMPTGAVGLRKIPVRNLWLLILYASEFYRQQDFPRHIDTSKVNVEDNPEDNPEEIANLVAKKLCHHIEKRLMRNLSYGYESKIATISRVRGRIDALTTECHRLLDKGKVHCKFDELTVDTDRNRYVRAALESLIKLGIKPELAHRCKNLAFRLERLGVSKTKPISYSGKSERFGSHDSNDQKMVFVADLAFSLALPTESNESFHLATLGWKKWKIFEKAVAGFYAVNLDKKRWQVKAGETLDWQKSENRTPGIDNILPSMQTDITIEHSSKTRLVIDTKYTSVTSEGQHGKKSLHPGNIYQMYAYLRSQEKPEDINTLSSIGMLLHPTVDEELTEMVVIQRHPIWFCTVDLRGTASSIRERLLDIHKKCFSVLE